MSGQPLCPMFGWLIHLLYAHRPGADSETLGASRGTTTTSWPKGALMHARMNMLRGDPAPAQRGNQVPGGIGPATVEGQPGTGPRLPRTTRTSGTWSSPSTGTASPRLSLRVNSRHVSRNISRDRLQGELSRSTHYEVPVCSSAGSRPPEALGLARARIDARLLTWTSFIEDSAPPSSRSQEMDGLCSAPPRPHLLTDQPSASSFCTAWQDRAPLSANRASAGPADLAPTPAQFPLSGPLRWRSSRSCSPLWRDGDTASSSSGRWTLEHLDREGVDERQDRTARTSRHRAGCTDRARGFRVIVVDLASSAPDNRLERLPSMPTTAARCTRPLPRHHTRVLRATGELAPTAEAPTGVACGRVRVRGRQDQ